MTDEQTNEWTEWINEPMFLNNNEKKQKKNETKCAWASSILSG